MDKFGLAEEGPEEQATNLHQYNRALFRSMMFFLDVVWEINMLTGTAAVLEDNVEPERNHQELPYDAFLADYTRARIREDEQGLFADRLSWESLRTLYQETSFEVHMQTASGQWEPHQVVLTPAVDKDGTLDCVYLCARNIHVENGTALRSSNEQLRRTVSQEEQFRLSALSGAILVYNINLTQNLIEDEFYEIVDGKQYPMLQLVGLTAPCSFDTFCQRWSEAKVPAESREHFLKTFNREYFLDAYRRGERRLEVEFDTVMGRGIPITLRNTALLLSDTQSGDIIAIVNGEDVSSLREEELRQREALRQAYESANNANAAKSVFLARMSHDLRTPINAIVGMTAIAGAHMDDAERVRDCLGKITMASKHLLALVNEVLDMSKIESGELRLAEEEFILSEVVDDLLAIFASQIDANGQKLFVSTQNLEHKRVCGDSQRLSQALMNLLSNATKYTPAGGKVSLTVSEKPIMEKGVGCYEFVVEDTGIGMSEEFLRQVFEPFTRAEDMRITQQQGTGLGLSIVRSIAQMMSGGVTVESELDRGTKFTLTVLLKTPEVENETSSPAAPAVETSEQKTDFDRLMEEDFSGFRALLVEDNELNAEIALELLHMMSMEADWAKNGQEAVDMFTASVEGYYDIILMDIQMPIMNGYEAARAIRALPREDVISMPILAVSANTFAEDVKASIDSGMNDHLPKPLDFAQIANALVRLLKRR